MLMFWTLTLYLNQIRRKCQDIKHCKKTKLLPQPATASSHSCIQNIKYVVFGYNFVIFYCIFVFDPPDIHHTLYLVLVSSRASVLFWCGRWIRTGLRARFKVQTNKGFFQCLMWTSLRRPQYKVLVSLLGPIYPPTTPVTDWTVGYVFSWNIFPKTVLKGFKPV